MPLSIFEKSSKPLNIKDMAVEEPQLENVDLRHLISVEDWEKMSNTLEKSPIWDGCKMAAAARLISQATNHTCAFGMASAGTMLSKLEIELNSKSALTDKLKLMGLVREVYGDVVDNIGSVMWHGLLQAAQQEIEEGITIHDFPLAVASYLCRAYPLYIGEDRHLPEDMFVEVYNSVKAGLFPFNFTEFMSLKILRPREIQVPRKIIIKLIDELKDARASGKWFGFALIAGNVAILLAEDITFIDENPPRMSLVFSKTPPHSVQHAKSHPPLRKEF